MGLNNTKIFAGPIYSITYEETETKKVQVFDVFAEDEISLHFFMAQFDNDRNHFHYDTFFPHYVVPVEKRGEILGAGAIKVTKKGEKKYIHDWQAKAMNHRF